MDAYALSPLDVNAQRVRAKPMLKEKEKPKAPAAKVNPREKDHPPPPPAQVLEPPSNDSKTGRIYETGKLLGKGGFAICHEARWGSTGQKYALKIVKSYMPQAKMAQKVGYASLLRVLRMILTNFSFKQSFKSTPR